MPTLKEIRQRLGWAVDQLKNFIERAGGQVPETPPTDSALHHVRTARSGLEEHITADSGDTTDDTTDPEPEPTGADPVIVLDPDAHDSIESVQDEATFSTGRMSLDTEVAYPGGLQSVRYDWIDQGCGGERIALHLPLPENARELWVDTWVRWSPNFFDDVPSECGTVAHKLIFGQAKALDTSPTWETSEGWGVNRWALHAPGGGSLTPDGGQLKIQTPRHDDGTSIVESVGQTASTYWDGEWHRVRMHWRSDPGRFWLEVDGETLIDRDGFTIHPEVVMTALLLGQNKDDGSASGTESLWWGLTRAWTEDPGW